MADTRSTHSKKIFTAKGRSKKDTEIEEFSGNGNQGGAWPSRPGEEQYEWEEPRVTGQTESQVGRTTDGTSSGVDPTTNRVDRLRLLGNGVVPQTAERALRILTERIK